MSGQGVESFGAWQKARVLFDLVTDDVLPLQENPPCWRLISQQVASADSICSNIEEGYGRGSKKEYTQFLLYARGSAQETRGRYGRLSRWLPAELVTHRVALCDEIIGILTTTIATLKRGEREK